jgi:hypothetical protein
VWEILHNPKYTGYQVWNRRQRKRGGKINPPETWVWSEEPAPEPLISREMFDKANLTAIKRDNVTKAKEGHDDYREDTYAQRSFLRCGLCGLRMYGNVRRGRKGAYYTGVTPMPSAAAPVTPHTSALTRTPLPGYISSLVRICNSTCASRDLPWTPRWLGPNVITCGTSEIGLRRTRTARYLAS